MGVYAGGGKGMVQWSSSFQYQNNQTASSEIDFWEPTAAINPTTKEGRTPQPR